MQTTIKLIQVYYHVCDKYNELLRWEVQRFSQNNLKGEITDEEIITIYLFCVAYEEKYKIKSMYNHIKKYWLTWFPQLPSYQTFTARLNRLSEAFHLLVEELMKSLTLPCDSLPIVLGDSMPVITCSHKRAGKVAPQLTDKGYCATKGIHYYGIKIHALALRQPGKLPQPQYLGITPASVHDLTALRPVLEKTKACASILDKAYCDAALEKLMAQNNNQLITPMKNKKGLATALQHFDEAAQNIFNSAISKIRQPIESLFNWINEHTLIQNASKVRSEKGLIVHVFGRLAAALLLLANFNS
jgi:hypothetical protein